jgi:hypothetical protein
MIVAITRGRLQKNRPEGEVKGSRPSPRNNLGALVSVRRVRKLQEARQGLAPPGYTRASVSAG